MNYKLIYLTILLFITHHKLHPQNRLDQPTINSFINQTQMHDPNSLPSSCLLFYDQKPANLIWSILIPTLVERSNQFEEIFTKLMNQIVQANLQDQIEIVFYRDNRDQTVGYKRNQLIANASGKYTCFVDDDDDVIDTYITMIYDALLKDCDCVRLVGIYSESNRKSLFVHSVLYKSWFESNKVYYRPPNHLNPIKRTITSQFKFPNHKNFGEDSDWSMQICQAGAIKNEAVINIPYYFYNFSFQTSVCWQRNN